MKRSEEFYEGDRDEILSTGGRGETMQEVLNRRWTRRALVQAGGAGAGLVLTLGAPMLANAQATPAASPVAGAGATGPAF